LLKRPLTSSSFSFALSREYNDDKQEAVHFLQIWALPHTRGLKPSYYTRHFTDAEKEGKLVQVVGPVGAPNVIDEREGSGPAPVHSYLSMFATILPPSSSVSHVISAPYSAKSANPTKRVYVHVIQSTKYNPRASLTDAGAAKVKINASQVLGEGDGAFVEGGKQGDALTIESIGGRNAEVVVFEMD
jgi:redox-sensitive bicupin YhaK (pirin superfamily)